MKVLGKILLAIFALFVLSGIGGYFYFRKQFQAPANQLVVSQLPATTPFVWEATKDLPHAALLVPISVPGCPRTCFLQLDTGAPYTLLKSNALAVLRAEYPVTRATLPAQGDSVRNFQFAIGQGQVRARSMRVRPYSDAAQLPTDPAEPFVIGTLGTDIMDGRVLVVDYPHRQLTLTTSVPDSLVRRAAFVPMTFKERRVMLSVGLEGKTQDLLFDSGSSAFALVTSAGHWQQLALPAAPTQIVPVNSWGKTLMANTAPTAAAMQFGAVAVPVGTVSYIEGMGFMQSTLTRFSGMGGMLGNAPFSQQTIILDVKGGRFGVVK